MSEKTLRRNVVDILNPYDPISVENSAYPGTPDVNFTFGWLELKYIDDWPVRASTPVRIPHYTPQQKVWILKRHRAGGNVWLLVQVAREYFLFDAVAAQRVGDIDAQTFRETSLHVWKNLASLRLDLSSRLMSHSQTQKSCSFGEVERD